MNKIWAVLIIIVFMFGLVAGCEKEKPRKLLPSEKSWIEKHPDGQKRSKPEDFAEFVIKDRCDPEAYIPWKRTVSANVPDQSFNPNIPPKPFEDNKIPVAVMDIEADDDMFTFRGFRSNDPDGFIDIYKWAINGVWVSEEPSFQWTPPDKKGIYYVQLVVMDGSKGEGSVEYRTGSNIDFTLRMENILCP